MANLEAADIGHAGEKIVEDLLSQNSWTNIIRDTWQKGSTDIKADPIDKTKKGILIQVKTALFPNAPAEISADEKKNIIMRAKRENRDAYAAYLKIDSNKKLVGNVDFKILT